VEECFSKVVGGILVTERTQRGGRARREGGHLKHKKVGDGRSFKSLIRPPLKRWGSDVEKSARKPLDQTVGSMVVLATAEESRTGRILASFG